MQLRDTATPGVPQGGLLVNTDSLLTVTETGFPGNTVDITFPVGLSSQFVTCPRPERCPASSRSPTRRRRRRRRPPPTTPPTTPTTPTTIPPVDTSVVPPTPPQTIPPTLPATGSSDATPLVLFGLVLLPVGVVLVAITRRRAGAG